ncbi:MAG TPA: hypothetical protein VL981_03930, partial [Candidatus Methylacidiphilales bacterium]|nr:hypothetical protein [Candidatus Methylacidiphilales bacterium]
MQNLLTTKRLGINLIILFVLISVPIHAEDWTTADGKTYKNIRVIKHDALTVTILDEDGGATIPFEKLSPELQRRFGYNPAQVVSPIQTDQDATGNPKMQVLGDSFPYYLILALAILVGGNLFRIPKGITALFAAAILFIHGAHNLYLDSQFAGQAVHTVGIVDKLESGVGHSAHSLRIRTYHVYYHYNDKNMDVIATNSIATETTWSRLHV